MPEAKRASPESHRPSKTKTGRLAHQFGTTRPHTNSSHQNRLREFGRGAQSLERRGVPWSLVSRPAAISRDVGVLARSPARRLLVVKGLTESTHVKNAPCADQSQCFFQCPETPLKLPSPCRCRSFALADFWTSEMMTLDVWSLEISTVTPERRLCIRVPSND